MLWVAGTNDFASTMNQPDNADRPGKGDRTHFTEHGAREMARLVATGLAEQIPALKSAIKLNP